MRVHYFENGPHLIDWSQQIQTELYANEQDNECTSTLFIDLEYDGFTDKLHMSRFSHQHHELFNGLSGEKAVADVQ